MLIDILFLNLTLIKYSISFINIKRTVSPYFNADLKTFIIFCWASVAKIAMNFARKCGVNKSDDSAETVILFANKWRVTHIIHNLNHFLTKNTVGENIDNKVGIDNIDSDKAPVSAFHIRTVKHQFKWSRIFYLTHVSQK